MIFSMFGVLSYFQVRRANRMEQIFGTLAGMIILFCASTPDSRIPKNPSPGRQGIPLRDYGGEFLRSEHLCRSKQLRCLCISLQAELRKGLFFFAWYGAESSRFLVREISAE